MRVSWPDLWFPPLNLWNFKEWRYDIMSGGMEDTYAEYAPAQANSHYKQLAPEPITVINSWNLNFNLGNALKYIARCDYKGQKVDDLQKAITYLRWELEKCKN